MVDAPTPHETATLLAARLRSDPDEVDPARAAEVGTELLDALDSDAGTEELRLVTFVLGFAVRAAPEHPLVAWWWDQLGFAHGWIADEVGSAEEYERGIACCLAAASVPQAPPEVAARAAFEAACLTTSRLRLEQITAERARQLIKSLDGLSLSGSDVWHATLFEYERAWALRWSYPLTKDIADLERAAGILRRTLSSPVPAEAEEHRTEAWDLLATVLERLYLDSGDLRLLEEALAAAVEARDRLPDDDEWLPDAHGVVARLADELFWNSDDEATVALDTAVSSFAAKRAASELDDDETISYALLLQARGCTSDDVPVLTRAAALLEAPEHVPGAEQVLAGLHESLLQFAGPEHAWQAIDWATRALSGPGLDSEIVVPLHGTRLAGLTAALEAFGGDEVAARCDVGSILAGARSEALAGADAARAGLEFRTAQLRCRWTSDRSPLDIDLFQSSSEEMADALRRMCGHADEDHKPKLAAVATLLEDMVPVVMGDRDPGPFRAALRDQSLEDVADMDGLLKWMDQTVALKAMADGRPVGARLQQTMADIVASMPESERESGPGAVVNALAETVGAVQNGDASARSAAYQKVIRLCDEQPADVASTPFVRGIRGFLAGLMTTGGHDRGQAELAIEDLERVLDGPRDRWSGHDAQLTEQLGHLLRQRGRPGDAERSRQLALRVLVDQTWRGLTRAHREHATSLPRLARLVAGWCREDGAGDDLVRVVEAERGVVLARGAGAELLYRHLIDTGRSTLAEEWLTARRTGDGWTGSRTDPVARLSEMDKRTLAGPLGPEEIRPLLRVLGLDALVYLVPNLPALPGTAVVVPARGKVTSAQLPLLTGEWFTGNVVAEPAVLDALAGWAWLAGGAAVLAAAEAAAPGRLPRVALVPVGALGSVPWAAAWRETGTGRRYLVQDVDITLVPSARLLARIPSADGEPVLLPDGPDTMPGPDYDEALEPSSTFLIRGAHAVVRGVWPLKGDPVLFSLLRHYLDEHRMSPAAALREAQLRMLDPRQALPAGVSTADSRNPAGVAAWGGFAHLGA